MARRLPYIARTALLSSPARKSTHMSMRRNLRVSLSRFRPSAPAPRLHHDKVSSLTDTSSNHRAGAGWTKKLNLSRVDDSSVNPGHTILTSPGATKNAVIDALNPLERPGDSANAIVIFASPRHAQWLTDTEFLASFIWRLLYRRSTMKQSGSKQPVNVLAAVVDGLHPKNGGREVQEGLSIQFGSLDSLLPGLWDEAPVQTPDTHTQSVESGYEYAHVSVLLRRSAYEREDCTVTLPLANTLFHNGRRTTLLASEWLFDPSGRQGISLSRMVEKRTQKIDLPMPQMAPRQEQRRIRMLCPLVPITHPRKIVEGLGNILAKVEINGEPAPASKELQVNIPLLLQARQPQSDHDLKPARIGVWALVFPERVMSDDEDQSNSHGATSYPSLRSNPKLRMHRLGTAVDKLAFEMKDASERIAWRSSDIMRGILAKGGRLHQILSGGGEWGAKASLLSLDPQTTYGVESEEDELDRFQRSFHGADTSGGAITTPGEFVQFFVEDDSVMSLQRLGTTKQPRTSLSSYPFRAFGVGDFGKEDHASEKVDAPGRDQARLVQLAPYHFGAFSAEGLFLNIPYGAYGATSTTTKVNTPGTVIQLLGYGQSG